MSEDVQKYDTFNVTVQPVDHSSSAEHGSLAELKALSQGDITSNSSNIPTANGNNVSFVKITYTIQPRSIRSLIKKLPPKTILDDVRYVKITLPLKTMYF